MSHIFFASYARADRDNELDRFIQYLREDVASRTAGFVPDVGFFDTATIRAGQQWQQVLGRALQMSRVLVCFYSPRYIRSVYCGKELRIFLDRLKAWSQEPANVGRNASVIFPVVWELHQPVPPVIAQFQCTFPGLARQSALKYEKRGLRWLGKMKSAAFREVALVLADEIKQAIDADHVAASPGLPVLEQILSAWEWTPYNVAAAYWHDEGGEWAPYAEGGPVVEITDNVISNMRMACREISLDDNVSAKLAEAEKSRDAVIAITDLKSVQSPRRRHAVEEFDQSAGNNCALLVVWNDPNLQIESAEKALKTLFPRRFEPHAGRYDEWVSVRSGNDLRERIELAAGKLRTALTDEDRPQRQAQSPRLEQAARDQGISTAALPGLSGPGGVKG